MNKNKFKIGDDVYFIIKEISPPEIAVKFTIPHICLGQIQKISYYYGLSRIRYIDVKTTFDKKLFRLTKSRLYLTFEDAKKECLRIIKRSLSNNLNKLQKLNILNDYLTQLMTMYSDLVINDVLGDKQKSDKVVPQELFIVTKRSPKFKLYLKNLIIKYDNKYYHAVDQNHYYLNPALNFNDISPFIEPFTGITF